MVDLLRACQIAKNYFLQNSDKKILSKIYEHEKLWIVFGKSEEVEFGSYGISIDKESGKISMFTLPSLENFAIIKASTKIDIPHEFCK